MTRPARATAAVLATLGVLGAVAGCGSDDVLTVYNAQHESLVRTMLGRLHRGDRHRAGVPRRQRHRAGQPDRAGRRRLAGRRVPHREQPGHRRRRRRRPAGSARRGDPRPGRRGLPARRRAPGSASPPGPPCSPTTRPRCPRTSCRRRSSTWPSRSGGPRRPSPPEERTSRPSSAPSWRWRARTTTRDWLTGLERNAEVYASNTAVMKAVDEAEVDRRRHVPLLLVPRPGRERSDRRRRAAALLPQPGPGRLRQRLRSRACSPPPTSPRRPSAWCGT